MAAPLVHEESSADAPLLTDQTRQASSGFVGQWQTLVSTTNWEKGQIICGWRKELENANAPVTQYSDEAWAQMVGDVTGQHVGRLRRTYERFGNAYTEYQGLYWSHFQVALDWQDAEMWLEGALQNGWSISQMRAQRWETVGDGQPAEEASSPVDAEAPLPGLSPEHDDTIEGQDSEIQAANDQLNQDDSETSETNSSEIADEATPAPAAERREPVQPMKGLAELPEDLAEAFEQFKLAILTHKMTGWQEISRDEVVAALSALEQLALAPSGDDEA